MCVNWLVIGSKRTHEARRAVGWEPIVDVARLVWQFDRVDKTLCELMGVNWLLKKASALTKREEQLQQNQLSTLPGWFGNLTALTELEVN